MPWSDLDKNERRCASNSCSMAPLHLKATAIPAIPPKVSTIRSWPKRKFFCSHGLYLVLKQNMLWQQRDFLDDLCTGATLLLPHKEKALTPHWYFYNSIGWIFILILCHVCPKGHSNIAAPCSSVALPPVSVLFLHLPLYMCFQRKTAPAAQIPATVPTLDTYH